MSIKDVVDIIEISKRYSFNWNQIVNEKEVVTIFKSYSDDNFRNVKWITPPNINELRSELEKIASDMLVLGKNLLYNKTLNLKSISK